MFLRCRTIKQKNNTYKYYQIVESKREKGKVRQKVIVSLGAIEQAEKIAKAISPLMKDLRALIDLNKDISPIWSKEYGLPFIYQKIFHKCGLSEIISNIEEKYKKLKFDLKKTAFNIILNRLGIAPK